MAKLLALPEQKIIQQFKGVVDFYEWKGIPVARKWPYTPRSHLSAGTRAQWADFAHVRTSYSNSTANIRNAAYWQATGTQLTAQDLYIGVFYNKLVRITVL